MLVRRLNARDFYYFVTLISMKEVRVKLLDVLVYVLRVAASVWMQSLSPC